VAWKNHEHLGQSRPFVPPEETGARLATFRRGPKSELRVVLDEYQSKPFIGLRIWDQTSGGSWLPSKKGVTVRMHELAELVRTLSDVNRDPV
jgi:hypothetical protein